MPACLLACWYGHLLFFCHQLTGNITEAASLGVLTTGTCTCRRFEFKNNSSLSLGNSNLSQAPLATSAPSNPTSYGHTGIPPSSSSSSLSLLHHHHHHHRHPSKPLDAAELFSTSGHVVGLPNGALSHLLKPKHAFCLISFSSGSPFLVIFLFVTRNLVCSLHST